MKKSFCLIVLIIVVLQHASAQIVHIPDSVFKSILLQDNNINTNNNNEIETFEVGSGHYIYINNSLVTSLTGLEQFKNLQELTINNTYLTSIDLSNLTYLKKLNLYNNRFSSLDVSKNTRLTTLNVNRNSIQTLDLSKNPELTMVSCQTNKLKSIDVSKNQKLNFLAISNNEITEVNLKNNPNLIRLDCNRNLITQLDLSHNPQLGILWCQNNNLDTLVLSAQTKLTGLMCNNNRLRRLDVAQCSSLYNIDCRDNLLTEIAVPAGLMILNGSNNALKNLDLSHCQGLQAIDVSSNSQLYEICLYDLSKVDSSFIKDLAANWVDKCSTVTSTANRNLGKLTNLYPNPANDILYMRADILEADIYNVTGELLLHNNGETVDISNLPSGIYYVKLRCQNNQHYLEKLIKE